MIPKGQKTQALKVLPNKNHIEKILNCEVQTRKVLASLCLEIKSFNHLL